MGTWYWEYMFAVILFIPVVMIVYGNLYVRGIPRKLNSFFGYRTKRTTKNQDTWIFAHNCIGKSWSAAGIALLPGTAFAMILQRGADTNKVALIVLSLGIVQVSILMITLIRAQTALKATFDENGNRLQT